MTDGRTRLNLALRSLRSPSSRSEGGGSKALQIEMVLMVPDSSVPDEVPISLSFLLLALAVFLPLPAFLLPDDRRLMPSRNYADCRGNHSFPD